MVTSLLTVTALIIYLSFWLFHWLLKWSGHIHWSIELWRLTKRMYLLVDLNMGRSDSISVVNISVFCLAGMIKLVSKHRAQLIYTRNTKGGDEEAAAEKAWSGTTGEAPRSGLLMIHSSVAFTDLHSFCCFAGSPVCFWRAVYNENWIKEKRFQFWMYFFLMCP